MSGCTGSNFANPEDLNLSPPTPSSNVLYMGMSEDQPPVNIEPIAAVPIATLCPSSYGFQYPRRILSGAGRNPEDGRESFRGGAMEEAGGSRNQRDQIESH